MAEHEEKHGEGEESHGSHGGSHGGGGHGGHGGGGHAEGEHEGAPEWLISFADNVALMMGFFVILLAMNMGPKGHAATESSKAPPNSHVGGDAPDMVDFVISIREAFNNPIDPSGSSPGEEVFRRRMVERNGGEATQDGPKGKFQDVQSARPSDYRQITAVIRFEDASATISAEGRRIAVETAQHIRDQGWVIEVRGHASQFETRASMETGMRLSYDRGLAVARAMIEGGVKRENLRIVACGDHDRVVARTNDSSEASTNQRVEIVVTNEAAAPDPFTAPTRRRPESGATGAQGASAESGDASKREPVPPRDSGGNSRERPEKPGEGAEPGGD